MSTLQKPLVLSLSKDEPPATGIGAGGRPLRVLSNYPYLKRVVAPTEAAVFRDIADGRVLPFLRQCLRSDLVILDFDRKQLLAACLLRWILPWRRFTLVSVDLILRPPTTMGGRLVAALSRVLLRRVDRFCLYSRDIRGYTRYYGIEANRAVYVPFKVNGIERIVARGPGRADGDYVLCAGRSRRDAATFVDAMARAGCPGVLLQQSATHLVPHGTAAWAGALPPNVRVVIDDGDSQDTYFDFIEKARVVVIPRFRWDIGTTGVSTYLVAMAFNKCVIISDGPGVGDVLTDEAVVVPPEDPGRLAEAVRRVWDDHELRTAIAWRGHAYAMARGGGERLLADVWRACLAVTGDVTT